MVWYDFVMLGILVYAAWQGAARGLVMQMAWIVAIVLCFKFADTLSPQIEPMISVESEQLRRWIAMFVLYLGFSLGSFLVARTLSNAIEKAKFQEFDRQLGGLFGLVKGVLLSLVVTFFAVTLSEGLRETVLRSKTGHIACVILDNVRPLIPEDAHPLIRDSLQRYQKGLNELHEEPGHSASPHDILADFDDSGTFHNEDPRERGAPATRNEPLRRGNSAGTTYQDFLSLLPDSWRANVGDSLLQEWSRLSAEERSERITELRIKPEYAVGDLLRNWYHAANEQGNDTRVTDHQSSMIDRIADWYPRPEVIVVETEKHLIGVPADVREAVLNDWYADVTLADQDPDPRTDSTTRIDDRILNQMRRIGVALDDLSYGLQERLRKSLR